MYNFTAFFKNFSKNFELINQFITNNISQFNQFRLSIIVNEKLVDRKKGIFHKKARQNPREKTRRKKKRKMKTERNKMKDRLDGGREGT